MAAGTRSRAAEKNRRSAERAETSGCLHHQPHTSPTEAEHDRFFFSGPVEIEKQVGVTHQVSEPTTQKPHVPGPDPRSRDCRTGGTEDATRDRSIGSSPGLPPGITIRMSRPNPSTDRTIRRRLGPVSERNTLRAGRFRPRRGGSWSSSLERATRGGAERGGPRDNRPPLAGQPPRRSEDPSDHHHAAILSPPPPRCQPLSTPPEDRSGQCLRLARRRGQAAQVRGDPLLHRSFRAHRPAQRRGVGGDDAGVARQFRHRRRRGRTPAGRRRGREGAGGGLACLHVGLIDARRGSNQVDRIIPVG